MYLEKIVSYVNGFLRTRLNEAFQRGKFYEIVKQIPLDSGELALVGYDNAGNDTVFAIDETYPFIIYHRFNGVSFYKDPAMNFGDSELKSFSANMIAGVYGKRKILKLTDEQLLSVIAFNFPTKLTQSIQSSLEGMKKCEIETMSALNYSISKSQEGVVVPDEDIFFTVNYKINIAGDRRCFSDCNQNICV